eukprot:748060-Amphidinium_carterae.1
MSSLLCTLASISSSATLDVKANSHIAAMFRFACLDRTVMLSAGTLNTTRWFRLACKALFLWRTSPLVRFVATPSWPREEDETIEDVAGAWTMWSSSAESYLLELMQIDDGTSAWRGRGASVQYRAVALSKYSRSMTSPGASSIGRLQV